MNQMFDKLVMFTAEMVIATALVLQPPTTLPKSKSDADTGTTISVKASGPVTAPVGKKCVIKVETSAKKVTWKVSPDLDTVPLGSNELGVWGLPGTYTILAMVPAGELVEFVEITLTITGDFTPLPPAPTLNRDVKSAYDLDKTVNKAELVKSLASVWRAASTKEYLDGYKPSATWYDVFSDVSATTNSKMGQTDIQGVRLAIQKHLDNRLPTTKTAVLDRKLAATEFGAVATSLEALSK